MALEAFVGVVQIMVRWGAAKEAGCILQRPAPSVSPLQAGPWLFDSPVSVTLTAVVSKYPDRCNVKNKFGS